MNTILLIEDDPILGTSMKELLGLFGYEVHWCNSFSAFQDSRDHLFKADIVLSDFYLGDGTFKDVFEEILELPNVTDAIICFTAAAAGEDLDFIHNSSAHYLAKPFRTQELQELLELCFQSV